MKRCGTIFSLLSLSASCLLSQVNEQVVSSASEFGGKILRSPNLASILFERNVNTFNWVGRAFMDTSLGKTWFRAREQFMTNSIRIDGAGASSRQGLRSDQQFLSLRAGHLLTTDFSPTAQWYSLVTTDNRSGGVGQVSIHSVLGGFEYSGLPLISLQPLAGYRWERQLGTRDQGFSYEVNGSLRPLELDGYRLRAIGQLHRDNIAPRLLESNNAGFGIQKNFLSFSRDSLDVGFIRNRREYYVVADSNIESRGETIISAMNLLDYELSSTVIATVAAGISDRILDKDTRLIGGQSQPLTEDYKFGTSIEEFTLDVLLQAAYTSPGGSTTVIGRLAYNERNEDHAAKLPAEAPSTITLLHRQRDELEKTKNNVSRRTSLSGLLNTSLTRSDRITVAGGAAILRYDTPSLTNTEDRDELLVNASVTTFHTIGPNFQLAIALDGSISHLVYLFGDRSGSNNFNRILRLSPIALWRPTKNFRTTNSFEVLSNYTVYDFETQFSAVRSFAFRQFALRDSTVFDISARVGLDFLVHLRLYERGQLDWTEFTERLENSFSDQTYDGQIRFSPTPGILFGAGVRYFSQTRYTHTLGEKVLDSFFRSVGPTCNVLLELSSRSLVRLSGWYEYRTNPDGSTKELPNMTFHLQYLF